MYQLKAILLTKRCVLLVIRAPNGCLVQFRLVWTPKVELLLKIINIKRTYIECIGLSWLPPAIFFFSLAKPTLLMLVLGWWLGSAHSGDSQGFHGSMDSRPFRSYRPRFACKVDSSPDPTMTQPKAMYKPWPLSSLIACLRVFGGVGRPEVATIRVFADQWISGTFGHFVLGSHAGQG